MSFKQVFNPKRCISLNNVPVRGGQVVYWVMRDQRRDDNWALLYAREEAKIQESGLAVVFNLVPSFKEAGWRQYHFMLEGLKELGERLETLNIPLFVLKGDPVKNIPRFVSENNVGLVVTDFSPLKMKDGWRQKVADSLSAKNATPSGAVAVHMVDAHNIVPVWTASPKQEYAARTIRPKINKQLDEWLVDFPELYAPTVEWKISKKAKLGNESQLASSLDWEGLESTLKIERSVKPVDWITSGEQAAKLALTKFMEETLPGYAENRNYPEKNHLSHLSPYLHFGQLSGQRVAWEVKNSDAPQENIDAYLEELIVRRELSDNYCYYNSNYDNFQGFPDWAKQTLNDHRHDQREYTYSLKQLENAQTHDDLWNASQLQMVRTGKMHGYMRMYWCKKILHWTESPEQAQQFAIYLNDKYELDGRDANGYTGIAWSIGGVHDRAWTERPIFGKIRYMSRESTGRKFDSEEYINFA